MTKDTNHSNFNIPTKKQKKKSKWMDGFKLAERATDIDKVTLARQEKARLIVSRRIQSHY